MDASSSKKTEKESPHESAPPPPMILKRFEKRSSVASHPEVQVQVPAGWKVISGGGMVEYGGAGALLTKSMPLVVDGVPRGWMAASKDHLVVDPGYITAYAVALYDPTNLWKVIVNETELGTPQQHPVVTVQLEDSYALVGGGAYDMYAEPGNLLVASRPGDDGKSWIAGGKDHLVVSPANIKAYAIGLRSVLFGKPNCSLKSATSAMAQHPSQTITASPGRVIVGGGAAVSRGGAGNMLVGLVPSCNGSNFQGMAKDHLVVDPQQLTVYAIECTNVVM
ncbi:unnamed protein product [Darwinula stevensoni]|uniref:Uncharacterized protein n=1 Tax=Darwinula stevensoni TaxID=69355 RepID=A0A7R8X448_9CRUS|nr:unnamed protein product [Darwinula stevensoni]CAG0879143.1 unnamed protein product [Darwinula stevensoni]